MRDASSMVIAIFGTVSNAVSLSYFISAIRSNRQKRATTDSHTTELFAALNISDLLVSVSVSLACLLFPHQFSSVQFRVELGFEVLTTICTISIYLTGFLTSLLAILRAIHLVFPLRVINWRAIQVSMVVYGLIVLATQICYYTAFGTFYPAWKQVLSFPILAALFLTVVLANAVSLTMLHHSTSSIREAWKRKATITMIMISGIYCVCNINTVAIVGMETYSISTYNSIPEELVRISYYILLPLNSACNPVVYLTRRNDMRLHVKTVWRRIAGCLSGKMR